MTTRRSAAGFNSPVPSLQGGQGQTVYIDGINGGDGGGGGALSGTTVIDAIAEVNVQMSAYTAEYGLKGGSQINVITKHGGAEYHGTAYWYKRHEAWNSTNYFNKINNRPKPEYRYSNLGGTIGGPYPNSKGSIRTATSSTSSTSSMTPKPRECKT